MTNHFFPCFLFLCLSAENKPCDKNNTKSLTDVKMFDKGKDVTVSVQVTTKMKIEGNNDPSPNGNSFKYPCHKYLITCTFCSQRLKSLLSDFFIYLRT